jgi:hypothetical protein
MAPTARQGSLVPAGVRIRRWPAQLASRRGLFSGWRTVKASMIWEKPLKRARKPTQKRIR